MDSAPPSPVILLVDIDCFFAQAEQIRRPELQGRPVIVGGRITDRSVVASPSYEARAFGVKTAMPIAQAARLCPQAAFLRGDFAYYADLSVRMHETCLSHTPQVERVSLDEGYLDLTGCRRRYVSQGTTAGNDTSPPTWPLEAACRLQADIHRRTGLVVSIGVGTSRMVAKVASELAKPGGVLGVRPGGEAALLAPLSFRRLPGVGPKTAARLERHGLRTVANLAAMSPKTLSDAFGPLGEHLHRAARGQGSCEVNPDDGIPRSISRETTFEQDTCDRGDLMAMLSYLLQRAGLQLRREGLLASTVSLKLRYADFQTVARSRTVSGATDHDDVFHDALVGLLPRTYTRRIAVRLVGVTLSGLRRSGRQLLLFDEPAYQRRSRLYRSVDSVRNRFGFSSLVSGTAIDLLQTHERTREGFQLPVSCLSR